MIQQPDSVRHFEKIFRTHFSRVKIFIFMLLKSEADAEDLAQDVFVQLWNNFDTWKDNEEKEGYIYTIAKNLTLNSIKHKRFEDDYREEQVKESAIKEMFESEDPLNSIYLDEMKLVLKLAL